MAKLDAFASSSAVLKETQPGVYEVIGFTPSAP
jgi:hypothetical protein